MAFLGTFLVFCMASVLCLMLFASLRSTGLLLQAIGYEHKAPAISSAVNKQYRAQVFLHLHENALEIIDRHFWIWFRFNFVISAISLIWIEIVIPLLMPRVQRAYRGFYRYWFPDPPQR